MGGIPRYPPPLFCGKGPSRLRTPCARYKEVVMCRTLSSARSAWLFVFSLSVLSCCSGCAVLYQLAFGDGHKIEAKYQGLRGQRVAVVCVMDPTSYGDGDASTVIAEKVGNILGQKVKDIEVVRPGEVADWMDTNDWDEDDFVEIGRGVNAKMVVGIHLQNFSTHESKTLMKGRADVTTTVYDVTHDGKEVFRTRDYDFSFPTSHAIPVISGDPRQFQRLFIEMLSEHIARNFHDYQLAEVFARDGTAYAH